MYWRRFTTRGSVWSIYTGLISSVVLIIFSPAISGSKAAMLGESVDFAWFPLTNPGIVSIPVGFLLAIIGSLTERRRENREKQAEMEVRSMTGVGAEPPVDH